MAEIHAIQREARRLHEEIRNRSWKHVAIPLPHRQAQVPAHNAAEQPWKPQSSFPEGPSRANDRHQSYVSVHMEQLGELLQTCVSRALKAHSTSSTPAPPLPVKAGSQSKQQAAGGNLREEHDREEGTPGRDTVLRSEENTSKTQPGNPLASASKTSSQLDRPLLPPSLPQLDANPIATLAESVTSPASAPATAATSSSRRMAAPLPQHAYEPLRPLQGIAVPKDAADAKHETNLQGDAAGRREWGNALLAAVGMIVDGKTRPQVAAADKPGCDSAPRATADRRRMSDRSNAWGASTAGRPGHPLQPAAANVSRVAHEYASSRRTTEGRPEWQSAEVLMADSSRAADADSHVRVKGRPGWDSAALAAEDMNRVIKTRSGLRLRSPTPRPRSAGQAVAVAAAVLNQPQTAARTCSRAGTASTW